MSATPTRSRPGAFAVASLCGWLYLALLGSFVTWTAVSVTLLGWRPVVVTSGSMTPSIHVGDVLLVEAPPDDVAPGAVIVFRDAQRRADLTAHRVVGGDASSGYRTKGDANTGADAGTVPAAEVVGVGRLVIPALGLPAVWAREHRFGPVFGFCMLTVAALACALRPSVERGATA